MIDSLSESRAVAAVTPLWLVLATVLVVGIIVMGEVQGSI